MPAIPYPQLVSSLSLTILTPGGNNGPSPPDVHCAAGRTVKTSLLPAGAGLSLLPWAGQAGLCAWTNTEDQLSPSGVPGDRMVREATGVPRHSASLPAHGGQGQKG